MVRRRSRNAWSSSGRAPSIVKRNSLGLRRQPGRIGRLSRYSNSRVYNFKRKFTSSIRIIMDGAHTDTTGAFTFALNQLPNYSEFTALFDKYRIKGISAQFYPRVSVNSIANLGSGAVQLATESPPIYTVVDYDDATAPTDHTTLEQYENCKTHYEFKPFKTYFKPMIAVSTYNGSFGAYGSSRNMWIDAASPDVQYYSLKWATGTYNNLNAPPQQIYWDVVFTYYIQCKYPR